MKLAVVALVLASFILSWLLTRVMRVVAPKIGFVDKPGGRKIHANPKPLGGGVAIFWGFAIPIVMGLLFIHGFDSPPAWLHLADRLEISQDKIDAYWSGIRQQTPLAAAVLAAAFGIHLLGLNDDRKAMGPYSKLAIQLAITSALVLSFANHMRIMTFLDGRVPMGFWISVGATVLWIAAITNAFNFLDNMDGLSSGVACVCTVAFLIAAVSIGYSQWFVAATLALLLGSMLGFLWHNFPPATIFMGDSGSLVIGLMLGVLTVRTTYLPPGATWPNAWYAVFAPVVVLALPLYDLIVVSFIRMMRGKSPFVGDTNHFSHRLVARGMSRRTAVLCLYLVTAATSISAILLPHVNGHFAVYIFVQTILILCMVALLEQHPLPPPPSSPPPAIKDESRPKAQEAVKLLSQSGYTKMQIDLSGKVAVVTGGTGELGRSMVRTLSQCGASVAINYLKSRDRALTLAKEITDARRTAIIVQADVTVEADVLRMRDEVTAAFGPADIIVNNAVIQYPWKSVLEQKPEDYESQYRSCVLHNVLMSHAFVPAMIEKKFGRVIAISTECAVQGFAGQSAYVSGKRGMDGVLRALAREVGKHNITVNQVAPGWMISDKYRGGGEKQEAYEKTVPLGRRGEDQDIANAVAFFASDLAEFITGAFLPVCGGNVMPGI